MRLETKQRFNVVMISTCRANKQKEARAGLLKMAEPTSLGLRGSDEALARLSLYLADWPHAEINSHSRVIPAADLLQSRVDRADEWFI